MITPKISEDFFERARKKYVRVDRLEHEGLPDPVSERKMQAARKILEETPPPKDWVIIKA